MYLFDLNTYNELKKAHLIEVEKADNGDPQKAVIEIQKYLDSVGLYMPRPRYRYIENDKSTHKFLDGRVTGSVEKKNLKYVNVLNPKFAYS